MGICMAWSQKEQQPGKNIDREITEYVKALEEDHSSELIPVLDRHPIICWLTD